MKKIVADFRGYNQNEKKWVYGAYVKHIDYADEAHHYIVQTSTNPHDETVIDFTYTEVDANSLGQYVEDKDQHDVPIYSGDIVHFRNDDGWAGNVLGVITFYKKEHAFELLQRDGTYFDVWEMGGVKRTTVLGNIYEHKNLIADKAFKVEPNIMALYRGYSRATQDWVYGYYVPYTDERNIPHQLIVSPTTEKYPFPYTEVVSDSLGQYTGIQDQLGRMIFTGDIVRAHDMARHLVSGSPYVDAPATYCAADKTFQCQMDEHAVFDFWEWGCKHALIVGNTFKKA